MTRWGEPRQQGHTVWMETDSLKTFNSLLLITDPRVHVQIRSGITLFCFCVMLKMMFKVPKMTRFHLSDKRVKVSEEWQDLMLKMIIYCHLLDTCLNHRLPVMWSWHSEKNVLIKLEHLLQTITEIYKKKEKKKGQTTWWVNRAVEIIHPWLRCKCFFTSAGFEHMRINKQQINNLNNFILASAIAWQLQIEARAIIIVVFPWKSEWGACYITQGCRLFCSRTFCHSKNKRKVKTFHSLPATDYSAEKACFPFTLVSYKVTAAPLTHRDGFRNTADTMVDDELCVTFVLGKKSSYKCLPLWNEKGYSKDQRTHLCCIMNLLPLNIPCVWTVQADWAHESKLWRLFLLF